MAKPKFSITDLDGQTRQTLVYADFGGPIPRQILHLLIFNLGAVESTYVVRWRPDRVETSPVVEENCGTLPRAIVRFNELGGQ